MKKQVFELLSAVCVYSFRGHHLAVDALQHYKVRKRILTQTLITPLVSMAIEHVIVLFLKSRIIGYLF